MFDGLPDDLDAEVLVHHQEGADTDDFPPGDVGRSIAKGLGQCRGGFRQ